MKPKEALAILLSAFRQDKIEEDTISLYIKRLSDIQPALLEATIHRIVDRSKFFPAIAEIRETAAGIAGILPMSSEEAVAIVRKADVEEPKYTRDGKYAYTERFWQWPDDVSPRALEAIRQVINRLGDPVNDRDGKRVFSWETDFKRVYGVAAEGGKQTALADLSRVALPEPKKALPEPPRMAALPEPVDEDQMEKSREMIKAIGEKVGQS